MRNRYFIKHVVIAIFLIALLVTANNSVGSSEPDQSVLNLVQLIEKLTKRIEALEQQVQILEAKVQALEAEKGKNEPVKWHQVVRVIDGDTILLSTGEKVRFIGVDTPETVDPRKPVEYLGKEATEYNRKLVGSNKVRLEFDVQERDKYGRLLAYVYLPDGTFVNAELVKNGYARVATYPPNVKHQDLFLKLEREARENNRGLWENESWSKKRKPEPREQNKDGDMVYITKTGTKYHRATCHYLRKGAFPITRQKAIDQGYTPCKVCKP